MYGQSRLYFLGSHRTLLTLSHSHSHPGKEHQLYSCYSQSSGWPHTSVKPTMPSRKRNKGKARKAKADAEASSAASNNDGPRFGQRGHGHGHGHRQQEQARICGMMRNMSLGAERECDHGCPHPPEGDSCTKFAVSFNQSLAGGSARAMAGKSGKQQYLALSDYIFDATNEGFSAGADGWNSASLQKVVSYLESLGTDILLEYPGESAFPFAFAIMIVETVMKQGDMTKTLFGPARDMFDDMERETTRFFYKRIKCDCLKEKYSQLRKKPSSGRCHNCCESKDRKELKVCTCCGWAQYCSKKCQAADWAKHRQSQLTACEAQTRIQQMNVRF